MRLLRKLALHIDGVDLTDHYVGDVFDLPANDANLLVAERWAELISSDPPRDSRRPDGLVAGPGGLPRALAADEPSRTSRTLDRIRQLRRRLDQPRLTQTQHRRAEDRFLEEFHDSRARTVGRKSGRARARSPGAGAPSGHR